MQARGQVLREIASRSRPDEMGPASQFQPKTVDLPHRESDKVAYHVRPHGASLDGIHYLYHPQLESRSMGPNSLCPNLVYANNESLANSRLFTRPVTTDNFQGLFFSDFPVFGTNPSDNLGVFSGFQPNDSPTAAYACHECQSHATAHPDLDISLDKREVEYDFGIGVEYNFGIGVGQVGIHNHAIVPARPSAPSISPSLEPLSPRHHSLSSVFRDDATIRTFINQHIEPNDTTRDLAFDMIKSPWLISNEPEPRLSRAEKVVKAGLLLVGKHSSRFEAFFDGDAEHRCRWMEGNERCTHEISQKKGAIGHAHAHFNYKPFACSGKCGILICRQRFTCATVLNDHVRKHRRTQACSICKRVVSIKNFRRHMKLHY